LTLGGIRGKKGRVKFSTQRTVAFKRGGGKGVVGGGGREKNNKIMGSLTDTFRCSACKRKKELSIPRNGFKPRCLYNRSDFGEGE